MINRTTIKLILSVLLVSAFIDEPTYGQKRKKGIVYEYDSQKLRNASVITWLGIDFSKARLTDASKIQEGELMVEKYVPGWIGLLNSRYNYEFMSKRFKGKTIQFNLEPVQGKVKDMDYRTFVTFSDHEFPIDSVSKHINTYDLGSMKGVGYVLIIENLNKPHRYATGYMVFFDMETKRVLHATKMKGLPGSKYGFSQWWKEGLNELFDYYFADYFKKIIKA